MVIPVKRECSQTVRLQRSHVLHELGLPLGRTIAVARPVRSRGGATTWCASEDLLDQAVHGHQVARPLFRAEIPTEFVPKSKIGWPHFGADVVFGPGHERPGL